ncbi:GntR family transcriptional regulator [Rhodopila sp.]|uniref:GntR family transcriptional regulator n=1 Tax=Rhodopila sp. TaxID=2480087 RepID=UPI003D113E92
MLLRENVYDALRVAILTCDLMPGQDLREQDLAARFTVSRSPVRDALLRLAGENLVTVLPRQGYRVNQISIQDAQDIFGLRLVIEPACAAAAALAGSAEQQVLDPFRVLTLDPNTQGAFIRHNRAFHAAVADLSGNRRMAAVARDLVEQSDRLVRTSLRLLRDEDASRLVAEHAAIVDAIQARNAALAETLCRQHIADALARVLAGLRRMIDPTNQRKSPCPP